jgi:hypothetical protein
MAMWDAGSQRPACSLYVAIKLSLRSSDSFRSNFFRFSNLPKQPLRCIIPLNLRPLPAVEHCYRRFSMF